MPLVYYLTCFFFPLAVVINSDPEILPTNANQTSCHPDREREKKKKKKDQRPLIKK